MPSRQLIAFLLAACAFAVPATAENVCALTGTKVEDLAWLQGQWISNSGDQTVRERWMGPYGGVLLGVGQTTKGQASRSFEYFRIAQTDTVRECGAFVIVEIVEPGDVSRIDAR